MKRRQRVRGGGILRLISPHPSLHYSLARLANVKMAKSVKLGEEHKAYIRDTPHRMSPESPDYCFDALSFVRPWQPSTAEDPWLVVVIGIVLVGGSRPPPSSHFAIFALNGPINDMTDRQTEWLRSIQAFLRPLFNAFILFFPSASRN